MRLQIALEFMIVFSFVLLVFLILFVTIASQRALISNQQLFSHIELVAQDIASQVNTAQAAGSGYSTTVVLPSSGSLLSYNVSITKTGEIIVSTTIAQQIISATAYSVVPQGIESNSMFESSSNPSIYDLQIANGTISLQNYKGVVCVDYSCPNTTSLASQISLSYQEFHAASFSGNGVYFMLSSSQKPTSATLSAWVYPQQLKAGQVYSIYASNAFSLYLDGNELCFGPSTTSACASSGKGLSVQNWTFVTGVDSSGTITLYLNGAVIASSAASPLTCVNAAVGACEGASSITDYFNGELASVQFYSVPLAAANVLGLYGEGIDGQPVNSMLLGWWLLNGNPNDYSGFGDNGTARGYLPFGAVAKVSAKVTNPAGRSLSNTLVGFISNLGNFTGGNSMVTQYTNANGIASSYLTQQQSNGYAAVKAIAYSGNSYAQANIVGWWPLVSGEGNIIYDLSGNSIDGTAYNTLWGSPNYVASLPGNGRIAMQEIPQYAITGSITESAWINLNSANTSANVPIIAPLAPSLNPMLFLQSGCGCPAFSIYTTSETEAKSITSPATGSWYLVTGVYNSVAGTVTVYVNGTLVASSLLGAGSSQTEEGEGFALGNSSRSGTYANMQEADVQIYSAPLSQQQVRQLYTGGIAGQPVLKGSLVGWWPLDGDALDYSPYRNNGTISGGATFVTPARSAYVNGTGMLVANFIGNGYIDLPAGKPWSPELSFTAMAWFQTTSNGVVLWNGQPAQPSLASGDSSPLIYVASGHNLAGGDWQNGGPTFDTSINVSNGKWNFVAVTQNATEQVLYLNGQPVANAIGTHLNVFPYNWTIGEGQTSGWPGTDGSDYYFNGLISNVQIYNRTLGSEEISSIYEQGIQGLPLESSGLVGWWPLSGSADDFSALGDNGTAVNVTYTGTYPNASADLFTSLGPYGLNFAGQNAFVQIPNTASLQLSTLTLAGWVNYAGPQYTANGVDWMAAKLDAWGVGACGNSLLVCYWNWGGAGEEESGTSLRTGTWYYLTAVIGSGTETVYLNGQKVLSGPLTVSNQNTGLQIGYGDYETQFLNGSVADVEVYKTALNASEVYSLYESEPPPSAKVNIPLGWLP